MMKKIFKISTLVFVFLLSFLMFLPKDSIYFLVEEKLAKEKVVLSNEQIFSSLFGFEIKGADVFYENIAVANVEKIDFKSYFFINKIKIKNIRLMESLQAFAPSFIDEVNIKYSVFDFKNINIDSFGNFGNVKGKVDLVNGVLFLELSPSNKMRSLYGNVLSNMKFNNGNYTYEYKF